MTRFILSSRGTSQIIIIKCKSAYHFSGHEWHAARYTLSGGAHLFKRTSVSRQTAQDLTVKKRTKVQTHTLFRTDSCEIIYLVQDRAEDEKQTLSSGTSQYRPYKGVPPPSPGYLTKTTRDICKSPTYRFLINGMRFVGILRLGLNDF